MPDFDQRDPWITDDAPEHRLIADMESDAVDAVAEAMREYLTDVRRAVLKLKDTTAAAGDDPPPSLDLWPDPKRWAQLLAEYLLPVLRRWYRRVADERVAPGGDTVEDWFAELAERLNLDGWADRLYTQASEELDDSRANGDTPRLQRRRLDTLLRLDAPIRTIRDRIARWRRENKPVPNDTWQLDADEQAHRNEAREISRWSVVATANRARLDSARAEQQRDGTTLFKTWLATSDQRTRAAHIARNHESVPLDDPFVGPSGPVRFPGDPLAAIEEQANCRCALAVMSSDDAEQSNERRRRELPNRRDADGNPVTHATTTATAREDPTMTTTEPDPATTAAAPSQEKRDRAEDAGHAMRGGRFPIETVEDLRNAIRAVGRAKGGASGRRAVRRHIMRQARRLGKTDLIPDTWNRDGSLKTTAADGAVDDRPWADRVAEQVPTEPPADWFHNPELTGPTKVRVTEEGRVYGHVAAWGTEHAGIPGVTVDEFRADDLARFHRHPVRTTDGGRIKTGPLATGGHASIDTTTTVSDAMAHYDDPRFVVADVAAGQDQHGIWVSGSLRPGVSPFQVMLLDRYSISGDWRNGELIAACSVSVPGFHLDDDDQVVALSASAAPGDSVLADADTRATWDDHGHTVAVVAAGIITDSIELDTDVDTRNNGTGIDVEAMGQAVFRASQRAADNHAAVHAAARHLLAPDVDQLARTVLADGVRQRHPREHPPASIENDPELDELDVDDVPVVYMVAAAETVTAAQSWVDEHGGLPRYIKRISKHLRRKGMSKSHAIATAVNVAKKMCRGGDKLNFPGVQKDVNKGSVAQACAAVAEWNRMKAAARAD